MFDVRFLPNPHYEPRAAAADRERRERRRVHQPRRRARRVLRAPAPAARLPAAPVPGRGQGAPGGGDRLHRRAAPVGRDRRAPRSRYGDRRRVPGRGRPPRRRAAGVIDHVGFEVSDLPRSARFYDAVFYALGARRMLESEHAIAYGVNGPEFWIVVRGRAPPARATATSRCRRAARRRSTPPTRPAWPPAAATTARPGRARSTGAATTPPTCAIPDGLRVEVVSAGDRARG